MLVFGQDFKMQDIVVMEPSVVVRVVGRDASSDPNFYIANAENKVFDKPINPAFFSRVATPDEIAEFQRQSSERPKKKKKPSRTKKRAR